MKFNTLFSSVIIATALYAAVRPALHKANLL